MGDPAEKLKLFDSLAEEGMVVPDFLPPGEVELATKFHADGYVIVPAENSAALERLRSTVAGQAAAWLGLPAPEDPRAFLDAIHEHVGPEQVNEMRRTVIHDLNREDWVAQAYYALARNTIGALVGNELAMQRRINLSVQMPRDETSVLPVHADVWDGNSPFEVVVWVPLVDCTGSKSMFLLRPEDNAAHEADFRRFAGKSVEDLYRAIEPDVVCPAVHFGEVMIFTLNVMHGNRVNFEVGTRWSFNARFKSLFSPYADKRLGEFFEPITIRPATRLGMNYTQLEGFDE